MVRPDYVLGVVGQFQYSVAAGGTNAAEICRGTLTAGSALLRDRDEDDDRDHNGKGDGNSNNGNRGNNGHSKNHNNRNGQP